MNVEVQKYQSEAHQRRVRYHGALLTANYTPQGSSFSDVPNVCIIYIAKFDIFGLVGVAAKNMGKYRNISKL